MTPTTTPPGLTPTQFDAEYKAAQPKAVQAFMNNPKRTLGDAASLAAAGYMIDNVTMYWGWSPYAQTLNRVANGYTWVPSEGMPPVSLAPGLQMGGLQAYEPNIIPPGAILVTLNTTLFPAVFAPLPGSAAALAVAEGN